MTQRPERASGVSEDPGGQLSKTLALLLAGRGRLLGCLSTPQLKDGGGNVCLEVPAHGYALALQKSAQEVSVLWENGVGTFDSCEAEARDTPSPSQS